MPDHIGLTSSIQAARQVGTKRKQGKVYGAITKDEQIEIDGLSYPINSAKSGCHVEWLQRLIRHAVAVEQVYQRVLIVRLELRNPPEGGDNKAIRAFMDKASKAIRGKYDHKAGYMWAREQETAKGHHYHVALLLDGDRVMAGQPVFELVEPIWRNVGGSLAKAKTKKGAENLPYFMMIGRGAAPLTDATYWLSYLAKPRGKGYRDDYAQDFGTGQLSSQAKPAKKGRIVKVAPDVVPGHIPVTHYRPIGCAGLTVGEFRAMGLGVVAAQSWGKVGGLKRVGKRLGIDPTTVRSYVRASRPGELEHSNALRERQQEAARAKGVAMLRKGATRQEVAEVLGVCEVTPWNWIEKTPDLAAQAEAKREARRELEGQAKARLLAGEPSTALAKALGLNRKVLVRLTKELGINRKRGAAVTPELRARALTMREAGATVGAIGEAVGVDPSTVAKWAKAAGV